MQTGRAEFEKHKKVQHKCRQTKNENDEESEDEESEDPEDYRVTQISLKKLLIFLGKSKNEKNLIKTKILAGKGTIQAEIKKHISNALTDEDVDLIEKYFQEI